MGNLLAEQFEWVISLFRQNITKNLLDQNLQVIINPLHQPTIVHFKTIFWLKSN